MRRTVSRIHNARAFNPPPNRFFSLRTRGTNYNPCDSRRLAKVRGGSVYQKATRLGHLLRRRLFTFCSAISLLLSVVLSVLWARSHRWADDLDTGERAFYVSQEL